MPLEWDKSEKIVTKNPNKQKDTIPPWEKRKIIEEAQEKLMMEQLFIKMQNWAKILEKTLIEKWDNKPELQKERWNITIEKVDNWFVVNSYWQKTTISAKKAEWIPIIDIYINRKGQFRVIDIHNLNRGSKRDEYEYTDKDMASIIAIANLINFSMHVVSEKKWVSNKPFSTGNWKLNFSEHTSMTISSDLTIINRDSLQNLINSLRGKFEEPEDCPDWLMEFYNSNWILLHMENYLNRRYKNDVLNIAIK